MKGIIKTVGDIPSEYQLITDSQDIKAIEESTGIKGLRERYGCLFVTTDEGEYTSIYGCVSYVPWSMAYVYKVK